MLEPAEIPLILRTFGVEVSGSRSEIVLEYLKLLIRWNEKINLTSTRDPRECLTRHFGESLFLSSLCTPQSPLIDVGSGAGFPGLALKIAIPELAVTLLEPSAKKRAFLREAARACGFDRVEVRPERFEDLVGKGVSQYFRTLTARAVGGHERLVSAASKIVSAGGRACLWVGRDDAAAIKGQYKTFGWHDPYPIPLSDQRVILIGVRQQANP